MMQASSYQVTVRYFDDKFAFKVQHMILESNTKIYELNYGACRYILVNEKNNWQFLGDFEPCQALQDSIVKKLKQRHAIMNKIRKLNVLGN